MRRRRRHCGSKAATLKDAALEPPLVRSLRDHTALLTQEGNFNHSIILTSF